MYACAPGKGSEPGLGWNWVINLAEKCEVFVITEGEWRPEIEDALKNHPQKKRIHFYYNPLSEKVRKMCWNQGDWRFYYYYKRWQKKTLNIALDIIENNHIDIIHQFNMIGFREPGYLWKIKEKPFVWGPVDAKENFPVAFLQDADIKTYFKTYLKNYITKLQLKRSRRVRNAVGNAKYVVAASSESILSFKKYFGIDSIIINETGCYTDNTTKIKLVNEKTLHLLWVGKFEFRKQLQLALKIMTGLKDLEIKLHIVGGKKDEEEKYKTLTKGLGISEQCIWHGILPHIEVQQLMQTSDMFLFTSVAEGTPHVVMEALGNNLPIICFDCCGHGDSVSEDVGIKIALSNPEQAIKDFVEKISFVYYNREILKQMSKNCKNRQQELSWESKILKMYNLYSS